MLLAFKMVMPCPIVCAACWISRSCRVASGKTGFRSTGRTVSLGTSSRKSPSRLASSAKVSQLIPVTLPPGRLRLATRPSFTGSAPLEKTIGIVVVAALAASDAGVPPPAVATITVTRRPTKSAASAGSRCRC